MPRMEMTAYFSLFRARCRTLLQYRAAAVAGIATQVFWGLIKIMILEAFYQRSSQIQPISFPEAVTYTWLGQAFFMMMPFSADPDPEVHGMMRSGSVAYELARPLDLYGLWYARALAARAAPTLLRCLPIFLLAIPLFGMHLPPSPSAALAWGASMVGALLLGASLATLITVTLLWTVSGEGIARLVPSLVILGSGLIIPLPLLPSWAQPILNFLPFKGLADAPFRLYMGHLAPDAVFGVVAHQLTWFAVFVIGGRLLVQRGVRRMVVQGG